MKKALGVLVLAIIALSCGEAPKENKVRQAVEEVVTQEFKLYEGAKRSLGSIEKSSQERKENLSEIFQ